MNVETDASTDAHIVDGRIRSAETKIINEGTDLEMIVGKSGTLCHDHRRHNQSGYQHSDDA